MKDRHVAAAGARIVEGKNVARHGRFDVHGEDVGRVAQLPQQLADAARTVADRVAVMRRRQPLVDDHDTLLTTSAAGGTLRRRRSLQPGSGSIVSRGAAFCSCASMSWYLRSTTRQS